MIGFGREAPNVAAPVWRRLLGRLFRPLAYFVPRLSEGIVAVKHVGSYSDHPNEFRLPTLHLIIQ